MEGTWRKYKDKSVDEIITLLHTFPDWKDVYKGEKVSIPTEKILKGVQEGFPVVDEIIKEHVREQEVIDKALSR